MQFFTYTPKNEKPKNFVLKGIFGDYSSQEVENEINALNIENVKITKVSKLSFKNMRQGAAHYLIQLSSESDSRALTSERHILYQKVRWEKLQRSEIFQCMKCMRTSHSSANCNMEFRCGRCKESHGENQCKVPKNLADKRALYCVNCEEWGHAASYRGCPFLIFAGNVKKHNETIRREVRENKVDRVNALVPPAAPPPAARAPSYPQQPAVNAAWRGNNNASNYLFPSSSSS